MTNPSVSPLSTTHRISVVVPVYQGAQTLAEVVSELEPLTDEFGTSRQRFEATPRTRPAGLGMFRVFPPLTRYITTPWPGTRALILLLVVRLVLAHRSVSR